MSRYLVLAALAIFVAAGLAACTPTPAPDAGSPEGHASAQVIAGKHLL